VISLQIKERKMRKILITVLCICLILTSTIVSFGDSPKEKVGENKFQKAYNKMDKHHKARMQDETEILEAIGFYENMIIDATTDKKDNIIYELQLTDDVISEIIVVENLDGILLDITEGNLHDELLFDENGDIYIDGYKVELSIDEEPFDNLEPNASDVTWSNSVFSGSTPYKTSYDSSECKADINAGKKINDMTVGVLSTLISKFSVYIGAGASIFSSLASDIKDVVKRLCPDAAYLSYKVYRYSSTVNTSTKSYYKYTGTFWMKTNYTGYSVSNSIYMRRVLITH